ncbi:MAG: 30S ribosomal protein S6 [Patescibacteria group bacterium]|nr:30S ribosomal protein S6 [Patescibacteria group bacterium]
MSKKNKNNSEGKKSYEISFLLKDPASDKSILDLLAKHNASEIKQSSVNPIKLAYPIKKHVSAYFGYINFVADPADIKEMSDSLRLNGEVIRFLVVTAAAVDNKKSEERTEQRKAVRAESSSSKALTNEALEEKLEEILK